MKGRKNKGVKGAMAVLLVLAAAFFAWVYWGNTSIQTREIRVRSERVPPSFEGFRIVHVSDLHNAQFGAGQSALLGLIRKASPDLIAVTGDLIDSRHTDVQKAMDFIKGAAAIAPVYYVTGNHEARSKEYESLKALLSEAGVFLLGGKAAAVERGGESLRLLGLEDAAFFIEDGEGKRIPALADAGIKSLLGGGGGYTILLSHRPELFDVYAASRVDLVLSGHAHGGQVRLPFAGGLFAPDQGLFPRYTEGLYGEDQTKMVVSRGLGNSIFPFRVNNRPELCVIILSR